jgi:CubicO group peptidase (beta-lactamase class C family)
MNFPHKDFEKASCKDANIEKGLLVDMFNKIEDDKLNIHGMVLLRDGNKVFDAYAAGYGPDIRENIYSISKSFTSVAIGILQDRKLLKLDDFVLPYVKTELKSWQPAYEKLTIRHLLTMSVGHENDLMYGMKPEDNALELFFNAELTYEPGTHFVYNNLATYLLSVIVTKITGMNLNDFLDIELYQPLEIEKPIWRKHGKYALGASGLELSSLDLAKFGLLLLNEGLWRDKQIVSKAYLKEATSYQINTSHLDNPKDRYGYGYQFWMNDFEDYRCAGLFKQYIVINKAFNVVFVTQAYEERELLNLFTSYVLPGFQNGWVYDSFTLRHFIQKFHDNSLELIKAEKANRTIY